MPKAAPLFVPSNRLEMGVPHALAPASLAPADLFTLPPESFVDRPVFNAWQQPGIPMLLLHDEYMQERGGRLRAGSVLMVDEQTAQRWALNGVAVPTETQRAEAVIRGRASGWDESPIKGYVTARTIDESDGFAWSEGPPSWLHAPQPERIDMSRASETLRSLLAKNDVASRAMRRNTWTRLS